MWRTHRCKTTGRQRCTGDSCPQQGRLAPRGSLLGALPKASRSRPRGHTRLQWCRPSTSPTEIATISASHDGFERPPGRPQFIPRTYCTGRAGSQPSQAARQWAHGHASMTAAREAAYAAHAAARQATGPAASVARADGPAAATAHMADHEIGPAFYALQAVEKSTHNDQDAIDAERRRQVEQPCP